MIIFGGWGLLIFVFGFVAFALSDMAEKNLQIHDPAKTILFLTIWAFLVWIIGRWLNSERWSKELIDAKTGKRFRQKAHNALFFIPMEYWAIAIVLFGVFFVYQNVQTGEIDPNTVNASIDKWVKHFDKGSDEVQAGYTALNNDQYSDAMTHFLNAANNNEAEAQYQIGLMYEGGLGVPKNDSAAVTWFQKAGDQGHTLAEASLGYYYFSKGDYSLAIKWNKLAAENGNSTAQYNLALMYRDGLGLEKNLGEAINWFNKAAVAGDDDAKAELAKLAAPESADNTAQTVASTLSAGQSPNYVPGKINIVFTNAEPADYAAGQATSCTLKANIHNNSKYHINGVTFKIGSWEFKVDEMNANSYIDDTRIFEITLNNNSICSYQATYITNSVKDAQVFDCSIPNMAEGDCQDLVSITSIMDKNIVEQIGKTETSLGEQQVAPLVTALSAAHLDQKSYSPYNASRLSQYANLMETIVKLDSQEWSCNQYIPDSVSGINQIVELGDLNIVALYGTYSYVECGSNKRAQGWVKAEFPRGKIPCLIYHDHADECSTMRFPEVSRD
jgi:TPR repeat protein